MEAAPRARSRPVVRRGGLSYRPSALLSVAYGEAENRGADPWGREDFTELAEVLEARGMDASSVRYFSE